MQHSAPRRTLGPIELEVIHGTIRAAELEIEAAVERTTHAPQRRPSQAARATDPPTPAVATRSQCKTKRAGGLTTSASAARDAPVPSGHTRTPRPIIPHHVIPRTRTNQPAPFNSR